MKRLCLVSAFTALAVAVAFPAYADVIEEPRRWELAAEVYQFTYREPGIMKDTGFFYGLAGSYIFGGREPLWLKLEARAASGNVDYDGQLSDDTPYSIEGITDFVFEARFVPGVRVSGADPTIDIFCGAGYRFLSDDSSFDPAGYLRQSNYLYSPIGISAGKRIGGWKIQATMEYDLFWYGMQESRLSDVNSAYNDLENEQRTGWGCRVSVRVSEDAGPEEFFIEPFVRYWDIEDSAFSLMTSGGVPVGYGIEPRNNTLEAGIRAGISF